MKHEVFIIGQTIDQKARRDGREARGKEEGRRERIEKGSREGIEKETKRQFEEKEGRETPPFIEFLDPTLRCSHCFFKSSGYDKLWCETECKLDAR